MNDVEQEALRTKWREQSRPQRAADLERRLHCPECGVRRTTLDALRAHRVLAHGAELW